MPTADTRTGWRREAGGIELPSTMVSILVIAAFLAAAALAVFAVIPWAQDRAAEHQADQLVHAQAGYYALTSTDDGLANPSAGPRYGHLHSLTAHGLLTGLTPAGSAPGSSSGTSTDTTGRTTMTVTNTRAASGTPGSDTFQVWVRSDSGRVLTATHDAPQPSGHNLLAAEFAEATRGQDYDGFTSVPVHQDLTGRQEQTITVSFEARLKVPDTFIVYAYQGTGLSIANGSARNTGFPGTTEWQRYNFTTTVKDWGGDPSRAPNAYNPGKIAFYDQTDRDNQGIWVRNVKIELGSVATPFVPAHHDH